tara:strand:+ start:378 stop:578 length:201 start_codon:yes stop_codon:yes gene_type:complete
MASPTGMVMIGTVIIIFLKAIIGIATGIGFGIGFGTGIGIGVIGFAKGFTVVKIAATGVAGLAVAN